ncbi:hypothetical protein lacNasYZ03_14740 [Lactobacillus nasalidis]|uniref:Uncharacterized protein n=2 Tax=Lactobacillus nasalidis TaxID=2797258 RepID=A0ABQ3WA90_9LACO|nr:hypothetical protein [Lactobacillus nasalidis]GHW01787.1 hypothetical protein lacNasYZ03_14740 [Lactobacillus nasalidis]
MSSLVDQCNTLRATIETQNHSTEGTVGIAGQLQTEDVTGANLDETISNLQNLLTKMQSAIASNQKIVDEDANTANQDRTLIDKIKEANQTISGTASTIKNYDDGIKGNLDAIKRKSQDSEAAGGVVVDNTETQKINTVKTDQNVTATTKVSSIDEANKELSRILADLQKQNTVNNQEAVKAATYKANALANIDDINTWLKEMKQIAENAKTTAGTLNKSVDALAAYKADRLAKLQAEIDEYKKIGYVSEDTLAKMQAVVDGVNDSSITTTTVTVGPSETIDFGDIGQASSANNGAKDGSIDATKETEKKTLTDDTNSALATAKAQDDALVAKINEAYSITDKAIAEMEKAVAEAKEMAKKDSEFQKKLTAFTDSLTTLESQITAADKELEADDKKEGEAILNKITAQIKIARQQVSERKFDDKYLPATASTINSDVADWNTFAKSHSTGSIQDMTSGKAKELVTKLAGSTDQSGDIIDWNMRDIKVGLTPPGKAKIAEMIKDLKGKVSNTSNPRFIYVDSGVDQYSLIAAIKANKDKDVKSNSFGFIWKNGNLKKATWEKNDNTWHTGIGDDFIDYFNNLDPGSGGKSRWLYDNSIGTVKSLNPWYYDYLHQYKINKSYVTAMIMGTAATQAITIPNAFVYYDTATDKTVRLDVKVTMTLTDQNGNPLSNWLLPMDSGGEVVKIFSVSAGEDNKLHVGAGVIFGQYTSADFHGSGGSGTGGTGEGLLLSSSSVGRGGQGSSSPKKQLIPTSVSKVGGPYFGLRLKTKIELVQPDGVSNADWSATSDTIYGKAHHAFNQMPVAVNDIDDKQTIMTSSGNMYLAKSDMSTSTTTINGDKYLVATPKNNSAQVNLSTNDDNNISDFNLVIDDQFTKVFYTQREPNSDASYMSLDVAFGGAGVSILPSSTELPTLSKVSTPPKYTIPSIPTTTVVGGLNTVQVNDVTAKAHTAGTYSIQSNIEYLTAGGGSTQVPTNIAGKLSLDLVKATLEKLKKTSSNTSLVVKRAEDSTVKTSSGNSLTVRFKNSDVKTSSGNSLTVRIKNSTVKTSSGNSLTVRIKNSDVKTSSGNSLVVRRQNDEAGTVTAPVGTIEISSYGPTLTVPKTELVISSPPVLNKSTVTVWPISQNGLNGAVPVVQTDLDGTRTVDMSIYADPSMLEMAEEAISKWNEALEKYKVKISATYTTSVSDLKKGVTVAIMESASSNEAISSYQRAGQSDITLESNAGLSTAVVRDILKGNGIGDVYNKSGTITAGDTLKNSLFTVQINTDGIRQVSTDAKTATFNTLLHELGHVFGLSHDDDDSLMTPSIGNKAFTGEI